MFQDLGCSLKLKLILLIVFVNQIEIIMMILNVQCSLKLNSNGSNDDKLFF